MTTLIIDCGSSKVPEIESCVKSFGHHHQTITIKELSTLQEFPYSGAIISGAPILLTQKDIRPYLQFTSLLFDQNFPILGICFGHQLMSLHYGGSVFMGPSSRTDIPITISATSDLFKGLNSPCVFNEDHCEYATLPVGFELIAHSDDCTNEAMGKPDIKRYGVQFHPETSGDNGQRLIDNFLELTKNP